ncbi:electron transfer flavoprotein subunit beta/FixA family protein [Parvicella tangerina]|uniref:Electron transfer flavoprotein subunit beta n=1 Tax=Parvicella tangerina TaxID=2829795 RepID=A0A916JJL9_9FLAO|nr:electron transfer flavoprotein beta subunit/FixA family protein [Parvicella tangerina]CAG5077133.1 Electron transfer flavoprotein subunit beta [Parvicella tangerina]
MKFLVCISKAPDTTSKIAFTDGNTKFDETGVQYIVNPYDEWYALVRALELAEANGGTVTTITVGTAADDPTIRKALAIGANDAVRIDAEPTDPMFVAKQIAEYAKDKGFDVILSGKETINFNGAQVGAMVAEFLDQPFVSLAESLELAGNVATLGRDVPGGVEVVEVNTPFVLSAAKGMAEQRIPNMRGIMAARTKPLNVVPPVAMDATTSVVSYDLPAPKSDCKYFEPDQMDELVAALHNEAKVI